MEEGRGQMYKYAVCAAYCIVAVVLGVILTKYGENKDIAELSNVNMYTIYIWLASCVVCAVLAYTKIISHIVLGTVIALSSTITYAVTYAVFPLVMPVPSLTLLAMKKILAIIGVVCVQVFYITGRYKRQETDVKPARIVVLYDMVFYPVFSMLIIAVVSIYMYKSKEIGKELYYTTDLVMVKQVLMVAAIYYLSNFALVFSTVNKKGNEKVSMLAGISLVVISVIANMILITNVYKSINPKLNIVLIVHSLLSNIALIAKSIIVVGKSNTEAAAESVQTSKKQRIEHIINLSTGVLGIMLVCVIAYQISNRGVYRTLYDNASTNIDYIVRDGKQELISNIGVQQ